MDVVLDRCDVSGLPSAPDMFEVNECMLTAELGYVEEVDEVETEADARVSLDFFDPLMFLVLDFMRAILMFLLILILDEG